MTRLLTGRRRRAVAHQLGLRDGFRCALCGVPLYVTTPRDGALPATLDHIQPRSKGGTNDPANLRLACAPCNNRRGDLSVFQLTPRQRRLMGAA